MEENRRKKHVDLDFADERDERPNRTGDLTKQKNSRARAAAVSGRRLDRQTD